MEKGDVLHGFRFNYIAGKSAATSLKLTPAPPQPVPPPTPVYLPEWTPSWGQERLDFGWDSQGGANMEFYSKDVSSRAGNLQFIYGGGTNTGKVVFSHYEGSSWTRNLVIDSYGTFDFKGNTLINYNRGSARALKDNFQIVDGRQVLKNLPSCR